MASLKLPDGSAAGREVEAIAHLIDDLVSIRAQMTPVMSSSYVAGAPPATNATTCFGLQEWIHRNVV